MYIAETSMIAAAILSYLVKLKQNQGGLTSANPLLKHHKKINIPCCFNKLGVEALWRMLFLNVVSTGVCTSGSINAKEKNIPLRLYC